MPAALRPHSTRPLSASLAAAAVTVVLLTAFVLVGRRANFDEWLVLRASWLITDGQPGNVPFLMPLTAALGSVLNSTLAPSEAFGWLRWGTVALVLLCLYFAIHRHAPDGPTRSLALVLTLSSGAFFSHGFEFRYDIVILCCWLMAWGLIARPNAHTPVLLGLLAATLAMHHTKGLFYAACLGLICLMGPGSMRRKAGLFAIGFLPLSAAWGGWLHQHQKVQEAWDVYRQFATLGVSHKRVPAWQSLYPRLAADALWWLLICSAGCSRLIRQPRPPLSPSAWMAMTPIAFILLHPQPWDYLLAPLIPFLALMASLEARHWLGQRTSGWRTRDLGICLVFAGAPGVTTALNTWNARGANDLQILDLVKQVQRSDDRALDPSGALFMVPATDRDWYRDTLWQSADPATDWNAQWDKATYVVASYRLKWIDPDWQTRLQKKHKAACGWLWMKQNDPRLHHVEARCPTLPEPQLLNYWERAN